MKSISNYSSWGIYTSYGLNTLGPLCLWQCFCTFPVLWLRLVHHRTTLRYFSYCYVSFQVLYQKCTWSGSPWASLGPSLLWQHKALFLWLNSADFAIHWFCWFVVLKSTVFPSIVVDTASEYTLYYLALYCNCTSRRLWSQNLNLISLIFLYKSPPPPTSKAKFKYLYWERSFWRKT